MSRDLVDITALIRSLQRAEGNPDCFRRGKSECPRTDCAWRAYCLPGGGPGPKEDLRNPVRPEHPGDAAPEGRSHEQDPGGGR